MKYNLSLRKCQYCGLKAYSIEDLELFTKAKKYLYGRRNICKNCFASLLRKDGKYNKGHKEACKIWYGNEENREKHKSAMLKRITMKQETKFIRIIMNKTPRTGFCSKCGKQGITHIHHDKYDLEHPLKNTRELCRSCHTGFHNMQRKELREK